VPTPPSPRTSSGPRTDAVTHGRSGMPRRTNALGIQAAVWTSDLSRTALEPVMHRAASIGYEVVELIVIDPSAVDTSGVRRAAEAAGVGLSMITGLSPAADTTSEDAEVRRRGRQHLLAAVETAHELGARVLGGLLHGALARYSAPPSPGAAERSADVLRDVAETAGDAGVPLALEIVSRYSNNLLNTAAQARDYLSLVGSPHVGAHLDTFQMNIEESDIARAVQTLGPLITHVHVAESDRGYLGAGRFPFGEFFAALDTTGYRGDLTVETFSPSVNPAAAGGVAAWRSLWTDPDDVAQVALDYLHQATAETASVPLDR